MQSVESPDKLPLWAEFTEVPDSPTEIYPRPDFHLHADDSLHADEADQADDALHADEADISDTTYGYPYREVDSDDTIDEDDCFIVITTGDAITLTLDEDLSLYKELYFIRPVTSEEAVTIATSGSETIEGDTSFIIFGAKTASGIDIQKITLKKTTSTEWSFVDGTVTGSTSDGSYVKYSNGTLSQWGAIEPASRTFTLAGSVGVSVMPLITFPYSFIDTSYSFSDEAIFTEEGAMWTGQSKIRTKSTIRRYCLFFQAATWDVGLHWQAIGRWK